MSTIKTKGYVLMTLVAHNPGCLFRFSKPGELRHQYTLCAQQMGARHKRIITYTDCSTGEVINEGVVKLLKRIGENNWLEIHLWERN